MIKKLLFLSASIFLIWQSYLLLSGIHLLKTDNGLSLLFVAWIINLFITGIFAFAGFALATHKLLPKSYYNISNPKQLKKQCKLFKVDSFKKMLLATLWRSKSQQKKYFNGRSDGIKTLEVQSMKSEFGHLIPFILINLISLYLFAIGSITLGIFTLLINIIGNFYPILLQRHHRMRIAVLDKIQRRKSSNSK